jgi:hypothetical protein
MEVVNVCSPGIEIISTVWIAFPALPNAAPHGGGHGLRPCRILPDA